jgi:hypothetical protein
MTNEHTHHSVSLSISQIFSSMTAYQISPSDLTKVSVLVKEDKMGEKQKMEQRMTDSIIQRRS